MGVEPSRVYDQAEKIENFANQSITCSSKDKNTGISRISVVQKAIRFLDCQHYPKGQEEDEQVLHTLSIPEFGLLFTDAAHLVLD
jgi:hypothetical protein